MKSISGIIEIPDDGCLERRISDLNHMYWRLGPADLVISKKSISNSKIKTYSYFSGLSFNKISDLNILYDQISANFSRNHIGKMKIEFEEIVVCCWNVFSKYDCRFHITKDKKITINTYDCNNNQIFVKNISFKEATLSSALRFWIPYEQLFRSLYNLQSYKVDEKSMPAYFSYNDLARIASELQPSEDLEYALAIYCLTNLKGNEFYSIIDSFLKPFPRIVARILHFIPYSSNLANNLYHYLINSQQLSPDDIYIAKCILEMSSSRNDKATIQKITPLLQNSVWSSPSSCMCFAKYLINNKKFEDAKTIANGAFFSLEYKEPERRSCVQKNVCYQNGFFLKPSPSKIEIEIIESQADEESDFIYKIVSELKENYEISKLKDVYNYPLMKPKNGEVIYLYFKGNTNRNNSESSFDIDDLEDLYDPGVSAQLTVPQSFYNLPFSPFFDDVLKTIETESLALERLIRNGSVKTKDGARYALVLGLKTGNKKAFKIGMNYFRNKNRIRPIHFLLEMAIYAKNGGELP
ncbi:hypothetical protein TVAG_049960, partial [Trichomonas vaginalis G3]